MIEIYFQDTLDAVKLHTSLLNNTQKGILITYDQANLIKIASEQQVQGELNSFLVSKLSDFILHFKEDQWILKLISTFFYFEDYEEQQQILSIAHSISDGDIRDIPEIHNIVSRRQLIEQILNEFLKTPISFSFESFVKFRLKKYHDILFRFVEIAIDEYKLEQEYQSFIQTLREFLHDREPKFSCMHILHQENIFRFFDDNFKELRYEEIKQLLDRKLLGQQFIYLDSAVIAPLVSIAPKMIYLYTNDVDYNMVQTILSVFQEKVKLCTIRDFRKKNMIN